MKANSSSFTKVLVLVAILACINLATAVSTPKTVNAQTVAFIDGQDDATANRFLRSDVGVERNLAVSVPGLEQAVKKQSWLSRLASKIKRFFVGKKTPTEMFVKMGLDKEGALVMYGSKFTKWVDYVRKNSKGDPELAIFSTLAAKYSDKQLSNMLYSAKKMASTKEIATKLETMQMANWVYAKEKPSQVFKVLGLNEVGSKVFTSPQFSRWTDFVSKAYPKNSDLAVYATLVAHNSDDVLAKMLVAAAKVDGTERLATTLRSMQFQKWKDLGKTPEQVKTMLGASDDIAKSVVVDYQKFVGKVKVD